MRVLWLLLSLFIIAYFISCSEESNPLKEEKIHPVSYCSSSEVELEFADSCTYDFVISFLSTFDSVSIFDSYLGSTFYIFADSGDANYWQTYFENDSSIQHFITFNSADSLILEIRLFDKHSEESESQRFSRIKHLNIIRIEKSLNLVYISVPENKATEWTEFFEQYEFIIHAYVIAVCTDFINGFNT